MTRNMKERAEQASIAYRDNLAIYVQQHIPTSQAEALAMTPALRAAFPEFFDVGMVMVPKKMVEAVRVLLAACIDDCGDPDDYPEDDSAVGGGLEGDMALTFKMMRDVKASLAALDLISPFKAPQPG